MSDQNLVTYSIADLTVGEIEEIEERSGQSINSFGDMQAPKGKMLRAIGFVKRRRTDPGFTWEQAADLRVHMGEDEPVPPSDASE